MTKLLPADELTRFAIVGLNFGMSGLPATINKALMGEALSFMPPIRASIQAGKFDTARALVGEIDFGPMITELAEPLTKLAGSIVWNGQWFAHSDDGVSTYKDAPDTILTGALGQLATFVAADVGQSVRAKLLDTIALSEGMATAVAKAEHLRKSADDALAAMLNNAVMQGKRLVDVSASLTTSRLITFGSLAELRDRGITSYVWSAVLDDVTCQICQSLHGKRFKVGPSLDLSEKALGTTDPDSLKSLLPFVTDPAALKGKTVLPGSVHPNCRCVPVPEASPLGLPLPDALARLGLPKPDDPPDFGEDEAA